MPAQERRFVVEVAMPSHPAVGREIIWHSGNFDATDADHKDRLQPTMIQVWEVQAYHRKDALAKIMLGKGKALFAR